jgi:hypothetical protein
MVVDGVIVRMVAVPPVRTSTVRVIIRAPE